MALLYYAGGKFSFAFFYQDKIVTLTAFLPEGLALAAVLIYGPRILPGIFLGQFALALDSGLHLSASLGVALVNSAEALLAYLLAERWKLDIHLRRLKDILILIGMILFILQPFSALLGNGVLYLTGESSNRYFHLDLFYWWFGNSVGQLLLTPLLLMIYTLRPRPKVLEIFLVAGVAAGLNFVLQTAMGIESPALLLLIILPLLLGLSAVNLPYALTAALAFNLSSLILIHYGRGVFAGASGLGNTLFDLDLFIFSTTILILIFGTVFRERQEAVRELQIAYFDPLTGTLDRRHLETKITQCFQDMQIHQTLFALCYLDLDHFKSINDTYGHAIGDLVLKEVTHRIKHNLREYDELIRLGGDEFILLITRLQHIDQLHKVLDRILKALSKPFYIKGFRCIVTASIGAVFVTPEIHNTDELLNIADMAMYQAKKEGRNRYFIAQISSGESNGPSPSPAAMQLPGSEVSKQS
ncbi:diguanylate cyclase domain-containing protein [Nitratifractor salsuginis]|uniref:diguanylate cyclase domain-containing protein n=1 Tax=Nitratifractor salsuginis TaxID=269261 RepID=UPI00145DD444|nr:diguanylate cyclase [Nitratifractor salsuginis]